MVRAVWSIREDSAGNVIWYLYDGLGSVVAEVDSGGNVTATRSYDVYGSVRGGSGSSHMEHEFCGSLGHTTEPGTGNLIYMRARWMDPVTGRFVSEDPGGNGNNWYSYCGDNPTNLADATGRVAINTVQFTEWAEEAMEIFNEAGGGLKGMQALLDDPLIGPTLEKWDQGLFWSIGTRAADFVKGSQSAIQITMDVDPGALAELMEGQAELQMGLEEAMQMVGEGLSASEAGEAAEEGAAVLVSVL